jgi:putative endonuclease
LVYYQFFITIIEAILVEKQIKAGSRSKKENLIKSINQNWDDLYDEIEW